MIPSKKYLCMIIYIRGDKLDEFVKFRPKGKTFCFNMTKYDCYELSKKQCCVSYKYISQIKHSQKYMDENSEKYCPNIARNILDKGFERNLKPVYLELCSCGHYTCDDGRHRVCLCGKLDIEMEVFIQKIDLKCLYCIRKEKPIHHIKNLLSKEYYLKTL